MRIVITEEFDFMHPIGMLTLQDNIVVTEDDTFVMSFRVSPDGKKTLDGLALVHNPVQSVSTVQELTPPESENSHETR